MGASEVVTRDWLAEAQEIARTSGDCRILASHQHVTALLALFDSTKANLEQMSQIVASIILDQLQPGREPVMWVPAEMTQRVERARCGVVVERRYGPERILIGTIVTLMLPTPASEQM